MLQICELLFLFKGLVCILDLLQVLQLQITLKHASFPTRTVMRADAKVTYFLSRSTDEDKWSQPRFPFGKNILMFR